MVMTTQQVHYDPPLEAILLRWPGGATWEDAVWRMLVGSQLRRGATRAELDAVWPRFFTGWPNPSVCRVGSPSSDSQIELLDALHGRREKVGTIRRLARVWQQRRPPVARVASLPGCRIREVEAHQLFAEHSMEGQEFADSEFGRWYNLRLGQGWTFDDETQIVQDTLATRLGEDLSFVTSEAEDA